MEKISYFYGPVLSRRLGFSLGVDIIPRKACSFDCIYCQLGSEPPRSLQRKNWVDILEFKRQLRKIIKNKPTIDYITISGSGEPTLHKGLNKIIAVIKKVTKNLYPVCVITNSSLLHDRKVRRELLGSDLIIPSLDAACASTFQRINLPHKDCSFKKIVSGIEALRKEYKGKIWLEIMMVAGLNGRLQEMQAFKRIIRKLSPDKVQINLPLRPTPQIIPIPAPERIRKMQAVLSTVAKVEIVYERKAKPKQVASVSGVSEKIVRLLKVRPESRLRLKQALGLSEEELKESLRKLLQEGRISSLRRAGKIFYFINDCRKGKKNSCKSAGRR